MVKDKTIHNEDELAPEESKNEKQPLGRIKTGKLERRMSMMKAGLFAGARFATRSAHNWMTKSDDKTSRQSQIMTEEADKLVEQLGELKGSVVKIGQMMALWGEHYLPKEVTTALHKLEDTTAPVAWDIMKITLHDNLPLDKIKELEIDPKPIGAASLGQVHRATRKSDGKQLCLKIQYPNISEAIETDLDSVHTLFKLFRIIPNTKEFEKWFDEIRHLLRREVDYRLEAETTKAFSERLKDDSRVRVPEVIDDYSTGSVLCLSYEPGVPIGSQKVKNLPQERRNAIAETCLDICWQEIFDWGEMQTDPNFGNYLIDPAETNTKTPSQDQVILLDFGAVRAFEPEVLAAGQSLVIGSVEHDADKIKQSLQSIGFYNATTPDSVVDKFLELCYLAIEPFANPKIYPPSIPSLTDEQGRYAWSESKLATRALMHAKSNVFSKHFAIPPKDFMYFSRKLIGTFTLMSVLDAKINGHEVIKPYLIP
ncbi:MAG TPA: ABC transporter [Gammaproteobacteria bacterium]|nr:ABC transporter [Gammaproteobacteria bacterium]HCK93432.1 ABC transporter [Gammaproteobacteria bacterium]|tara:strand:- start:2960 stop:4405 length:1446 start_codon:yes stop_codon:yes gene_type:complete